MNIPEHAASNEAQNAKALFEKAYATHQSGQLEEALLLYRQVIAIEPDHVNALTLAGILTCQNGDYEEGIRLIQSAIAIQPENLDALFNLGTAFESAGQLEDAANTYRNVITLRPDVLDPYKQLAAILDRQEKTLEAEEVICRALIVAPDDAKLFYALIQRQVENRHLDGALDTCEQFFNAYPRNMRALAFKAFVLNERGEGMAARQLLDFDRLIRCGLLQDAPGYASIEELNADLVEFALSNSTLNFEPAQKSTKQGSQTASLQGETAKPIATLRQLIEHNINEYFETHSGHAPHPYLDSMPAEFSLDIWATVLNPKGHQKPHFHPGGWLSGVYYPALPSAMHNVGYA